MSRVVLNALPECGRCVRACDFCERIMMPNMCHERPGGLAAGTAICAIFVRMDRAEEAHDLMAGHRTNCAQAILSTYGPDFGLERDMALTIAQGFGGGMARLGRTGGAVSAAYMVLGLSQKVTAANPRDAHEITYQLIREFNRSFETLHGSLVCRELIGHDLGTLDGLAEAREKGVFTTVCPRFVRDAAQILEILLRPQ